MRMHEFGKLPVVYQGRVKPLDTLARNTLRLISDKETYDDERGSDRVERLPAIRWFLDVVSESPEAEEHPVYRIDDMNVLSTLGLERRKDHKYALAEFRDKIPELERQLAEARKLDPEDRSHYQRKLFKLEQRLRSVLLLQAAFGRIIPPVPTAEEREQNPQQASEREQTIVRIIQNLDRIEKQLTQMQPPLAIPKGGDDWETFSTAWNKGYVSQIGIPNSEEPPAATFMWDNMLNAWAKGETKNFQRLAGRVPTTTGRRDA